MSPGHQALLLHHMPDPGRFSSGEAALFPALLRWLIATGRIRERTRVAQEVPWLGRRIDLALMSNRGITTAFELKIGRLQRVFEQAIYNQSSFHRSWVVTGNRPKSEGLRWAHQLGVGLLVVQGSTVTSLVLPTLQRPHSAAVARLRAAIDARAAVGV